MQLSKTDRYDATNNTSFDKQNSTYVLKNTESTNPNEVQMKW